MEENELQQIKEIVAELLEKMTIPVFSLEVTSSSAINKDSIGVKFSVEDPQILIGHSGQTLIELERLLKIILTKKTKKDFYINLDINDYKAKKIEYLKNLATSLADQVVQTQEEKMLPPMPNYERRIVHTELLERRDVVTESQGEGVARCVVIKPAI